MSILAICKLGKAELRPGAMQSLTQQKIASIDPLSTQMTVQHQQHQHVSTSVNQALCLLNPAHLQENNCHSILLMQQPYYRSCS